jgi:hypothetical protein
VIYTAKIYTTALLVGLVIAGPMARAQVIKVKELDLDPHRDRRVLFGMAVTPRKEIVSLVANSSGQWAFYLVDDWLDQKPTTKKVFLPGFFSKRDYKRDRKSMETMDAQVFATRDGEYAVCVGSAMWLKRVRGRAVGAPLGDDIVAVVDLSKSEIVATANTADLDLFGARGVTLDNGGFLRIDSLSSGKVRKGAFIRLAIPSLQPGPRCAYDWVADSPTQEHAQATTSKACSEVIGSRSLADYLKEGQPRPAPEPKVCQDNQSEFCRWPGEFTPDGRFGVALRMDGHDNLWGSWVVTRNSYIVFSRSRKANIGEIKEPTNDSFQRVLVSVAGRDYLLDLQSGTHLTVYELQDRN